MIVANYLMLSVIISSMPIIYTQYIYGEFDGELRNHLSFDVEFSVNDLSSFRFYFVDTSGNKLAVVSEAVRSFERTRHFQCHFNGMQFNMAIRGDTKRIVNYHFLDEEFWMKSPMDNYAISEFWMNLTIADNNLYYERYWNDSPNLAISNIFASPRMQSDTFPEFPTARNFTKNEHKTFVWVGSVVRDTDHNKHGRSNKLIGCIDVFRSNYDHIGHMSNGEFFSFPCEIYEYQDICNRGKCHNKYIRYNILDCRIPVMNTRKYCWEDLSIHDQQMHSYLVTDLNLKSTMIKLAWRPQKLKSNCLIEILGVNGSTMLFYTDYYGNLVMCHGTNTSMSCDRTLSKILSKNKICLLFIKWKGADMTVKISGGEKTKTFVDEIVVYPHLINVGFSTQSDMCETFHGELAFRFNKQHLKKWKSIIRTIASPSNTSHLKRLKSIIRTITSPINRKTAIAPFRQIYTWQIILLWSFFVFSMMLVCINFILMVTIRRRRKTPRPISNIYEEQIEITEIPAITNKRNRQL